MLEPQVSARPRQLVGELLDLAQEEPPLRLKWYHLSQDANGEIVVRCPKMPSDLGAKIGVHVDNQHPEQKEEIFGYVHLKTTTLNPELVQYGNIDINSCVHTIGPLFLRYAH